MSQPIIHDVNCAVGTTAGECDCSQRKLWHSRYKPEVSTEKLTLEQIARKWASYKTDTLTIFGAEKAITEALAQQEQELAKWQRAGSQLHQRAHKAEAQLATAAAQLLEMRNWMNAAVKVFAFTTAILKGNTVDWMDIRELQAQIASLPHPSPSTVAEALEAGKDEK